MKTHILLYPSCDIVKEYNGFIPFSKGMEISIGDTYNAYTYKIKLVVFDMNTDILNVYINADSALLEILENLNQSNQP